MIRKKTGKALVVGGTPRVNLLPPEELERRSLKGLRMRWLGVSISAFVLVALAWGVGLRGGMLAHGDVDAAAADSAQLQSQLADYSEVVDLRTESQKLKRFRGQAGSNDLDWWALLAEVRSVLPEGVSLVGFRLAPGPAPVPGTDPPTQVGLAGTLTFTAASASAQTRTITRLREVRGFISVDAGALSSGGTGADFTFVTTVSADQTLYTGRFDLGGGK
jgi:type IV pilus assembly protein PilN